MIDGVNNIFFFSVASIFLVLIIYAWFFLRNKKQNFSDIELVKEVFWKSSYISYLLFFSIFFILFSFILILSAPYREISKKKIVKNGIDIEIVFDLSRSMDANDLLPSRIDTAKTLIAEFIWSLWGGDRVGVVSFAWKPFQSAPLTFDYDFLQNFFTNVSTETLNQNTPWLSGTAIGDALLLAESVLHASEEEREKIIILLTDGEANVWTSPDLALKLLQDKKIKVYTIWIGGESPAFIEYVSSFGAMQRIPVGPVDTLTLKNIAKGTWGKYFRAQDSQSLKNILSEIQKLESSDIEYEKVSFHQPAIIWILYLLWVNYIVFWYFIFFRRIII